MYVNPNQKRLFIFAGYDANGVIDQSVVVYVRALSQLGDLIFYMDSDASDTELNKIKPYTIYAGANRHCEYDFGSYKRGYIWARDNGILSNYDLIYLVNDSVYAPLLPLRPVLEELESKNTDAIGMVFKEHSEHPHIQSWFIGNRKTVFLSKQFDSFMSNITRVKDKGEITSLYEHGFTRLLTAQNFSFATKFNVTGHSIYNDIRGLFKRGLPFMKKVSFTRRHGALGKQVLYVLNHIEPEIRNAILENANRVYGEQHVKKFLTNNIFKIIYRNIRHAAYKLGVEGI